MEPNIELMNLEAFKIEIKEHDVQILYKYFYRYHRITVL